MRTSRHATALLLSCIFLTACDKSASPSQDPKPLEPGTITLTRAQQEYVKATNTFALNISAKVSEDAAKEEKDFIFSPLSVSYLLGMLNNGAAGATGEEICRTLGYGDNDREAINEFCRTFMEQSGTIDETVRLQLANAIVLNRQFAPLKEAFVKAVKDNYSADVQAMNFQDGEAVLSHVNGWCSEKTLGMIPKILENVNPSALAYLMNAIYFKGIWSHKFDRDDTRKENFTREDGSGTQVDMMNITETFFRWRADAFEALSMPYGNGSFRMTFFLPGEGKSVGDVIGELTPEVWTEIMQKSVPSLSAVKVPKFETEYEITLNDALIGLGMPSAFNGMHADFSAMTDVPCCLSFVLQKAKIKVDEEGSEAAAVTIAGLVTSIGPGGDPAPFFLDKPFLYAITEGSTGAILFIGSYGAR